MISGCTFFLLSMLVMVGVTEKIILILPTTLQSQLTTIDPENRIRLMRWNMD